MPAPILYVEDDPAVVELTLWAVQKAGLSREIVVASDGEEAARLLFANANFDPAVLLLDLNLPKIGGLELLEMVRAHERRRGLRVIILTSCEAPLLRARAENLGTDAFMIKPMGAEDYKPLLATLDRSLRQADAARQ